MFSFTFLYISFTFLSISFTFLYISFTFLLLSFIFPLLSFYFPLYFPYFPFTFLYFSFTFLLISFTFPLLSFTFLYISFTFLQSGPGPRPGLDPYSPPTKNEKKKAGAKLGILYLQGLDYCNQKKCVLYLQALIHTRLTLIHGFRLAGWMRDAGCFAKLSKPPTLTVDSLIRQDRGLQAIVAKRVRDKAVELTGLVIAHYDFDPRVGHAEEYQWASNQRENL